MKEFFNELSQLVWDINGLFVGILVFGLLVKLGYEIWRESINGK